ncbi:MAG: hypothetical protein OHK0046_20530 [Anaerolineae bacterium]
MSDLFVEIFPVEPAAVPVFLAYQLISPPGDLNRAGHRLARQLKRAYQGNWLWFDQRLLTDNERSAIELMITLDVLKAEQPALFEHIESIERDLTWQPGPQQQAEIALRHALRPLDGRMADALKALEARVRNALIEREHKLQAWAVGAVPSISISIASRMIYDQNIQQFAGTERDAAVLNEKLADFRVVDPQTDLRARFERIVGPIRDHRERLLSLLEDPTARQMVTDALDGEWVVEISEGRDRFEYLASLLKLIVPLSQISRFDVDVKQATLALQMTPAVRAQHVRAVSDVAKEAGMLGSAYNSRTMPDRFFSADFEMNLRFDANRVRPYKPEALPVDFTKCGVYKLRDAAASEPLKVCVVNTLTFKVEDFVEAMQRYLKRHFDFSIEVIRERQVRVVSRANLESAVRVVEKENPDIILAFFPDDLSGDQEEESDQDATATYIQSLTLGRALPTHVITQSTLDDPDAMSGIVMNLLGKTGSAPFVLAEPMEGVDYVVGLDVVREVPKGTEETHLTAIARVYKADGEFLHYTIRSLILQEDALPYVLMRDLFPQKLFGRQRVVIHHDGEFAPDLLAALTGWSKAIGATFYPVEIVRYGAPRMYALAGGVVQPPWGSAFKLNDREALLVSALPKDDLTPQPLHIRSVGEAALPLEEVLRGTLVWTLLAYNTERLPKMPVTVINADEVGYWLRKGNTFGAESGTVPFWL